MPETFAVPAAARARPVHLLGEGFVCRLVDSGLGVAWVHLAGELDIATAARLERILGCAELRARLVMLDLRKLTFMDSCGIRVITNASTRAHCAGRRLLLVRAPRQVRRLLALTGAAEAVEIVELADTEPAIHALLQLACADEGS